MAGRETWSKVVIACEGFFDVMKIVQETSYPAVALMGSALSQWQADLLVEHFRHIVLMFDGDNAGKRVTDKVLMRLGRRRYVRAIELPPGSQPDQLTREELIEHLRG